MNMLHAACGYFADAFCGSQSSLDWRIILLFRTLEAVYHLKKHSLTFQKKSRQGKKKNVWRQGNPPGKQIFIVSSSYVTLEAPFFFESGQAEHHPVFVWYAA